MKEHEFTSVIRDMLFDEFGEISTEIFEKSLLIQYLNEKTVSASRGSKSRASFGNIYALYVLIEDYIQQGYHISRDYEGAEGAAFSDLLQRQRELPFGSKLQNHALNHRLNQEFLKYFPLAETPPILRDPETHRYWINEYLLIIEINGKEYQLAGILLKIIEAYIDSKQESLQSFIQDCEKMQKFSTEKPDKVITFVSSLLRPNVDARIFEIVSFAILKTHYGDKSIYWGWELENIEKDTLTLYKTGRTNANDGGIDFVMRPLGRFFQVMETLDLKKYFLDIDKVQKYPLTFVVKTELDISEITQKIRKQAKKQYPVRSIIERYMTSIEEIINIPILLEQLEEIAKSGKIQSVVDEIIKHSRVEFDIEL